MTNLVSKLSLLLHRDKNVNHVPMQFRDIYPELWRCSWEVQKLERNKDYVNGLIVQVIKFENLERQLLFTNPSDATFKLNMIITNEGFKRIEYQHSPRILYRETSGAFNFDHRAATEFEIFDASKHMIVPKPIIDFLKPLAEACKKYKRSPIDLIDHWSLR